MSPISRIQRQLELNARDIRRAQKAKKKRASGKGSDSGFSELEELTKELAQKSSSLQAQLVAARAEANLNKQLALNLSKAEKDPKQEPQPTPYHIHSPYTHQTSHYHYHKAPMMLPSTVQELDTQLSNMLGRARVSKDIVNRELASIPKSPKRSHRPTKVDGYISPFTAMHQSIGAKTETFGRLHQSRPPSPSHMRPRSALAGGTGLSQWEESHNSSEAKLVQRKAWLERFIIEKNRF
ncbi:hypothetical protein BCR33DRAFT_715466 [Rhizoclosmatium globosum]|uniref:Uncharacterized protein n=1 Tax=Rhizoclosmatium globosum TaxID=329046 RepID=A0A1Y2CH42_9FUNG|nr:hypothetical protein BCR33DRAFT_715466 [Rhizoclosmatium globosum]|eukprot:ORY46349.1 hypothetical protein BCR33DRAFT_715466 [Rhizoclosmatium globosum]